MKLSLSVAALCALASAAAPALALDFPPRKPGLWEMSISNADAGMPARTVQHCIDAATDQAMRDMGWGMGKDACSKRELRSEGGTLVSDSVCKIGSTTATTHAVITGDFGSAYHMESKSSYAPPLMGRSTGTAVVDTRWVGPCKAGQKPGDIMMGNGARMNILEMTGAAARK